MHHLQEAGVRDRGGIVKALVNIISSIAVGAVVLGGCALDSKNILIPAVMIMSGLGWFFLRVWVTNHVH